MSFLGPVEQQLEKVASDLHIPSDVVMRRIIEATFSSREDERLFLDMVHIYHDVPHHVKRIWIQAKEHSTPEAATIYFSSSLRDFIVHGIADGDYWRKILEVTISNVQKQASLHPSNEANSTRRRLEYRKALYLSRRKKHPKWVFSKIRHLKVEQKPFYETATPEEWLAAFTEWTESHRDLPTLPEQSYDRAYFYEDRP